MADTTDEQGAAGATGVAGAQGAVGATGAAGVRSAVGAAGAAPTADELRRAIREVRTAILDVVTAIEDIRLQQIPQIRADYAVKIGCWEKELLEAEVAARRAKRRYVLVQAQANQGVVPEYERIEAQLDDELADWTERVREARSAYERALEWRMGRRPLPAADAREMHRLYRTLMKRLHPDVRAGEDERRAEYFSIAQEAYRRGDVAVLRSLEVATRRFDPEDDLEGVDDVGALSAELELQEIERSGMERQLEELEACEEMRLGSLLRDPEWVSARTMELRGAVREWERVRREYDGRTARLREALDGS
jgi:hypothetical protein